MCAYHQLQPRNTEKQADNSAQSWPRLQLPDDTHKINDHHIKDTNISLSKLDNPVSSKSDTNNPAGESNQCNQNANGAPLQAEHFKAMAAAKKRAKKINRAASVASFNGWSAAVMASFSLLFAIFSISSAVIGLALAYIAYQEFKGRKLLRDFKPNAATHLGWNQVIFSTMIIAYAAWGIYESLATPAMSAQYAQYGAEVQNMMQPYDSIYTTANLLVYAGIGLFGIIFQGGIALYYFTRKKYIQSYLHETPDWIIELQRHVLID